MKKALIAIIATIYVIAIVIVSFLGTRAEIINKIVEVEEILLDNKSVAYPGITNPTSINDRIISVYTRPDESEINEEGKGYGKDDTEHSRLINWNYKDIRRDYAIFIEDYFYLYANMGGKYTIETSVLPIEATNKTLSYYLQTTEATSAMLEMTSYGEITFKQDPITLDDWVDADIIISSTDFSDVSIDVLLKWAI